MVVVRIVETYVPRVVIVIRMPIRILIPTIITSITPVSVPPVVIIIISVTIIPIRIAN